MVLGTFALNEPALVRGLCENHPGRVIIAVDAKDGLVATSGWTEVSAVTATELALRFRDLALFGVLYTDIARDGTRSGPNVEATAKLARDTGMSVIAAGGVGTLGDLRALSQHPGIDAAIVGRAIYDKIFSVEDAIAAARGP